MSLFKGHFFYDLTRKYQLVFGSMFSDIEVKLNNSDGTVKDLYTVPVIHSPKEKFIQRLQSDFDPHDKDDGIASRRRVAMNVPMIAYEMVDMQYDGTRKLAKNQYIRINENLDTKTASKVYTPCPYTLTFEVNIVSKTQVEMMQIIEQIIPAFNPDVNISIKGISGNDFDVPITFIGLFRNDTFLGLADERRQLMWTLNFTMKSLYFTPMPQKKIILDVSTPIYHMNDTDDLVNAELLETFKADAFIDPDGRWEIEDE